MQEITRTLNILMTAGPKYMKWIPVALSSLFRYNHGPVSVTVLHGDDCDKRQILRIKKRFERRDRRVCFYEVNEDDFAAMFTHKHFTKECYYRFLFPEVYKTEERALWLDTDIAIRGSLAELYNSNFEGSCAVACLNRNQERHKKRLGLDEVEGAAYFNCGMMLLNCKQIRETYDSRFLFSAYRQYEQLVDLADQDIFNLVFRNKVKIVDHEIYNKQIQFCDTIGKNERAAIKKKALMLHYIREIKPWDTAYPNPLGICYLKNMLFVYPVRALVKMIVLQFAVWKSREGHE